MNSTDAIRAFLDALDEPAMLLEDEVIAVANEAAEDLLGSGLEGSDIRLAIRHPQALEFILARAFGDLELTGIGSPGRPWRLSLRPVEARKQLLRLTDRSAAHAAEKMRVDFVANASHELRTPLTAVIGYAESLEDGDEEAELVSRFAGTIRTEARRMLRIIEDLMSLSRIEADRFVAPADRVSIEGLVRSVVERNRPEASQRGCEIALEVEQDLPEVPADRAQLTQLLDNLLSNAMRYGCASENCRIRVSASRERQWIRIEVSDTGPGIAREHLPFVTRRFYRVDAARSRDSGGTGLGLAIVKHIVERHRGTLDIVSGPGQGTTVTVRIPQQG